MQVELSDEQDDPLPLDEIEVLAEAVLRAERFPDETSVALAFVTPDRMALLNAEHMDRAGPTDVLAFPLEDLTPGRAPEPDGDGPPLLIGDVVICPGVVRDQAASAGVEFADELALMVVHGLLHLLGYDHTEDADAELMEERERELLALAGRVRP